MSNLEDQLLEYFSNPEAADLNTVLKAAITEIYALRKQVANGEKANRKLTEAVDGFTKTLQRKNDLVKRLEQQLALPAMTCEECGRTFQPVEKVVRVRHAYCEDHIPANFGTPYPAESVPEALPETEAPTPERVRFDAMLAASTGPTKAPIKRHKGGRPRLEAKKSGSPRPLPPRR